MRRSDDWITELHYKESVKLKLQPKDSYLENGNVVMTEDFHKRRGSCCGNNCRHCPYHPQHIKNNQQLR
jgi:hypothetical protein|tara:strand:- start:5261 stop:5467 length:207 start_codon:yes stop_codon:yes gene_type:complete